MSRASPLQPAFNAGEISPWLAARTSFSKFRAGLATCLNAIPLIEGGFMRRSGTRYIAEVKDSSKSTRLRRFEFSETQAYQIEVGDKYMRFFRNQGQIMVGNIVGAITNGTFDFNITSWTERSTGTAAIAWSSVGEIDRGAWTGIASGSTAFGDAAGANLKNAGLLFKAVKDGIVTGVRVKTGGHREWCLCGPRLHGHCWQSGRPGRRQQR